MRCLRGNPLFMGGHGERRRELAQKSPRHSALRPIARSHAPRRLDNRSDSTRHGRPGERCKLLHGKLRIATLPLVVEGQKAGAEERDEHVEVRPQVLRQPQRVALCSMSTRGARGASRRRRGPLGRPPGRLRRAQRSSRQRSAAVLQPGDRALALEKLLVVRRRLYLPRFLLLRLLRLPLLLLGFLRLASLLTLRVEPPVSRARQIREMPATSPLRAFSGPVTNRLSYAVLSAAQ